MYKYVTFYLHLQATQMPTSEHNADHNSSATEVSESKENSNHSGDKTESTEASEREVNKSEKSVLKYLWCIIG